MGRGYRALRRRVRIRHVAGTCLRVGFVGAVAAAVVLSWCACLLRGWRFDVWWMVVAVAFVSLSAFVAALFVLYLLLDVLPKWAEGVQDRWRDDERDLEQIESNIRQRGGDPSGLLSTTAGDRSGGLVVSRDEEDKGNGTVSQPS